MFIPILRPLLGAPMRIVFVRHAQSERNKAIAGGIYVGDCEYSLKIRGVPDHRLHITEEGREKCAFVGDFLRERIGIPDMLIDSGYVRTIETSDAILDRYTESERNSVPRRSELILREREPGYAFHFTEEEVGKHFGYMDLHWKIFGHMFSRPIGGESLLDLIEGRLKMAWVDMMASYAGQTIVVVTHCRVIQCFRIMLGGMSMEEAERYLSEPGPSNCSATIYEYDPATGKPLFKEYVSFD